MMKKFLGGIIITRNPKFDCEIILFIILNKPLHINQSILIYLKEEFWKKEKNEANF